MSYKKENWKIEYVPEKPPIPPDQQPTVDVFTSVIEPKLANALIKRLTRVAPLENLRHVKRIRKKILEEGECQLSVILCVANENNSQLDSMPHDVQEIVNSYQLSVFITKVCKYAATSKEEWEEQCKLWPTSYHPPTYNIDGISGFSEEDSQSIFSFMKLAIDLAKSGSELVNAAVIVDPSVKKVIATACDEVCTSYTQLNKNNYGSTCQERQNASSTVFTSTGAVGNGISTLNGCSTISTCSYNGVSCLYPWRWAAKPSLKSKSSNWHPLRHAVFVAIEISAARERILFPSSGPVQGDCNNMDRWHSSSTSSPAKRLKIDAIIVPNGENMENSNEDHTLSGRPYLCTGYDMYLIWEPCTMCAMALVHQRFRRIFYAFPNPNAGALGSIHRLQGEKSLNHHYAVFRVSMPEDALNIDASCSELLTDML